MNYNIEVKERFKNCESVAELIGELLNNYLTQTDIKHMNAFESDIPDHVQVEQGVNKCCVNMAYGDKEYTFCVRVN